MKKNTVLSYTKKILLELAEVYGDLAELHARAHNLDRVLHPEYYKAKERDRRERQRHRALRALRDSRMIAIRKKGTQILFTLTDKGLQWVLQQQCAHAKFCPKGECIIVIFDVPESQRAARDQFRHFLAEHYFQQLQRSVWMSTREVLVPLQVFVHASGSKPWIHVFRAKGIALG